MIPRIYLYGTAERYKNYLRAVTAADENGQISQCAGRDCASKLYTEQTCSTEREIRSAAHPDGCKKTENVKDGQR